MTKTLFATLAAAAAVAAIAAPAAAQGYGPQGYGHRHDDNNGRYEQGDGNINARQAQLSQRIEWGVRRGTLDRGETAQLREHMNAFTRLEARYRVGGLNRNERADLDARLDRLEARVTRETHDRDYGRR